MSNTPVEVKYSRDIFQRGLPVACSFSTKIENQNERLKEAESELIFLNFLINIMVAIQCSIAGFQEVLKKIQGLN